MLAEFPADRCLHDPGNVSDRRSPIKYGRGKAWISNENGRIAGATRRPVRFHLALGRGFDGLDHLQYGMATARAQVHSNARVPIQEILQRADMGIGKVRDMDVVPDGRAVRCRVVGAEDFEYSALSERGLDRQRNGVSLGVVAFANFTIRVRARRVEIRSEERRVGKECRL